MYKFGYLILPFTVFLMMSCSSGIDTLDSVNDEVTNKELVVSNLSSDLPRDLSPDVADSVVAELVASNNEFALNLYTMLAADDKNVFFSPFSISQALAMAYAGARGSTEKQMQNTLHFTLSQELLHPAFNALDLELAGRSVPENVDFDGDCFRLNIANSLWGQISFPFLTDFLDNLSVNYGAGMQALDIYSNPDGARILINDWVSEHTEEKIRNILPPGSVTPQTALVLVNAIYFNAPWNVPFLEVDTYEGDFYLSSGDAAPVSFMWQKAHFNYAEGDGFQALELPYDGDKTSMVIILPEAGTIRAFESSLSKQVYTSIINNLVSVPVSVTIPKFCYSGESISLKGVLSGLGMADCFGEKADFSGISESVNLSIDDILHKSYITVNEAGTEAAAATAGLIPATGGKEPEIFVADSPFIFYIRDMITGTVLFTGRIMDPEM